MFENKNKNKSVCPRASCRCDCEFDETHETPLKEMQPLNRTGADQTEPKHDSMRQTLLYAL